MHRGCYFFEIKLRLKEEGDVCLIQISHRDRSEVAMSLLADTAEQTWSVSILLTYTCSRTGNYSPWCLFHLFNCCLIINYNTESIN
jgi:hypothetical protein